ncbi:MAG: ferredoxin--NADP reductase [Casimicrobiaceae bacterium]|nr:ferredoxin--NADP reductase [Casimicrobiaceae bacterium]MCX8097713.1 ferredoxin--NADP reductase [Casimicrobiaceae bacterium]
MEGRVVARSDFTETLFALRFDAQIEAFSAGQFVRVGVWIERKGERIAELRPYSLVNAPEERPLEVVLTLVPESAGGVVSPALHRLRPGDALLVGRRPNGFFTLSEVPSAPTLWALSTGTGLGPFLSILATERAWQQFETIVLVHAVRYGRELIYRDRIEGFAARHGTRFRYVPIVSREDHPGALRGRIPALITSGELEARAGLTIERERCHVMLCGNPGMLADTTAVLEARGLTKHRLRKPGQITTEAYW